MLVENDNSSVALAPVSPRLDGPPAIESPSFKSIVPKRGPVPTAPLFWLMTLLQSLNTSSFCRIVCLGWLILPLLHRLLRHSSLWLLNSSRLCLLMRWSASSIIRDLCLCRSVPAIGPMVRTQRRIGLQRSFTMLLGAAAFAIIGTSYRPALMANGLTGESFRYRLALTRQSRRLPVVGQLIVRNLSSSISFMSTLHSATVSW